MYYLSSYLYTTGRTYLTRSPPQRRIIYTYIHTYIIIPIGTIPRADLHVDKLQVQPQPAGGVRLDDITSRAGHRVPSARPERHAGRRGRQGRHRGH